MVIDGSKISVGGVARSLGGFSERDRVPDGATSSIGLACAISAFGIRCSVISPARIGAGRVSETLLKETGQQNRLCVV
jgi:hypothetical protein